MNVNIRRIVAGILLYTNIFQLAAAALPAPVPDVVKQRLAEKGETAQPNVPALSSWQIKPFADLAQTGKLSNLSLSSEQLGFTGPLGLGANYDSLTGTYLTGQYIQKFSDKFAVAVLGEYGQKQYRFNGTAGFQLTAKSLIKFTAERLSQVLPYLFDSGNIDQRTDQNAYGFRYEHLIDPNFLQDVSLGGYYANAPNIELPTLKFISNGMNCGGYGAGFHCINQRRIAGATSSGTDVGADFLVSPSTQMAGRFYYDRVHYNTAFGTESTFNASGLGGGFKVNQLVGDRIKVMAEAEVRKIYDTYGGGLSWLPSSNQVRGLELSLVGQHLVSHNLMPSSNNIGFQLSYAPVEGSQIGTGYQLDSPAALADVGQWVRAPAVHMERVLAVAEQITRIEGPTITSIVPNFGPLGGGNTVTIHGYNFVNGVMILFGGQLATVTYISSTTLTATVPAGAQSFAPLAALSSTATKVVNVVVINPDGQQSTFMSGYTYTGHLPPAIRTITPASGPITGGTTVTITGTNFTDTSSVTFGGLDATIVSNTDMQLIVTTPAHSVGLVNVAVTTPDGTATSISGYTYVGPPTLTSLAPTNGPETGGTAVVITGTNFTGASSVQFGSTPATSFIVNSMTQITAVSPAGTGVAHVSVTNNSQTSSDTPGDQFSYVTAPAVSALSPSAGPLAGGNVITITGINFNGATAVQFGTLNATSFTVDTATQITATAPGGTEGVVDVTITTPGGTSAISSADQYTYEATPAFNSLSPTGGPIAGGTSVTISGSSLTGTTGVTFGGVAGTVNSVSNAQVIVTTPANGAGSVTVALTTAGGSISKLNAFTYFAAPTLTSLSPSTGPTTGGTTVTIDGTNFVVGQTSVNFDGSAALSVTVSPDGTMITAVSPPGHGAVSVSVTTPGGTVSTAMLTTGLAPDLAVAFTLIPGFVYVFPPTVTALSPHNGPTAGGTTVTITGTALATTTAVSFGAVAASSFTIVSPTRVTAISPAGAGVVDVTVTTTGGPSPTSSADQFTYVALPAVNSVSPSVGSTAGGNFVTITGVNFIGATSVNFGTAGGSGGFTVTSDGTSITAVAPASGAVGPVYITVTTAGGTSAITNVNQQYTYVTTPVVSSLSPTSGPLAGGNVVTINGSGYTTASTASFGGVAGTGVVFLSASQITAVAPASSAQTVDVTVATSGVSSATSSADHYTYVGSPQITTSLNPSTGATAGGLSVTITGTGLSNTSSVTFNGVAAAITSNTDTSLVVTTPNLSSTMTTSQSVPVVVTTPGGVVSNTFAYVAPPTVTAVDPVNGPTTGGTVASGLGTVTITGTNFTSATAVNFGTTIVAANNYTIVNTTTITAIPPTSSAGLVNVSVTTPIGGVSTVTAPYTYVTPPGINSLSPITGSTLSTTPVTIHGSSFLDVTIVQFAGAPVPFTIVNDTTITLTAPTHAAGAVDVTVSSPGGTATAIGAFTYVTPVPQRYRYTYWLCLPYYCLYRRVLSL